MKRLRWILLLILAIGLLAFGYLFFLKPALENSRAEGENQAQSLNSASVGLSTGEDDETEESDAEAVDAEPVAEAAENEEVQEENEYGYASYIDGEVTPKSLKEAGYPGSLITLYKKNEEAREFVLNYATYEGMGMKPELIDVSSSVKKGKIPYFCQWDERWGYEYYGDDYLAVTGCGPTCLSMVYCGLTGDSKKNPLAVARLAEKGGYAVGKEGSMWSIMTGLGSQFGLQVQELYPDKDTILQTLENKHPIIAIMGEGTFTDGGHFIVLCGVNKHGNIEIRDPNSKLRTKRGWKAEKLISEMQAMWAFSYEK